MNLIARILKVQKKLVVGAFIIAALVGCEQVSEDVKTYLINTGWLKIDSLNQSSLNGDQLGTDPQLVTVGSKLYAVHTGNTGLVRFYYPNGGFISYSMEPMRVAVFNNDEFAPVWTMSMVALFRQMKSF